MTDYAPLTDRVDELLAVPPSLVPILCRPLAYKSLAALRELRDAHKAVSEELVAALARCHEHEKARATPSTRELACNIRRNLKHLAADMAELPDAGRYYDYINHMDTLAQQIEGSPV